MSSFIIKYDPDTQTGTAYNQDEELELLFGLVYGEGGEEWLPIEMFKEGVPKDIPSCFTPDELITKSLTEAKENDDTIVVYL